MRIKLFDRFLAALTGLLVMLAGIYLFLACLGVLPATLTPAALERDFSTQQRIILVVIALVLLLLGVHSLSLLFRRRRDKGFIMQRTEYGDMSISMNALESMVKKCVNAHQELKVNATRISRARDGIQVDIKITLLSGANIPLTVNALQKQIKQYITSCSGIDVEQVRVMVETDTAKLMPPAPEETEVQSEPAVQQQPEVVEEAASQILQHKEEPQTYAAEPSAEAEIAAEEDYEDSTADVQAVAETEETEAVEEYVADETVTETMTDVDEEAAVL